MLVNPLELKSNNVKSLVFAQRTIHSKKPCEVRKRIENLCLDLPRIELFAREKKEGWDVWGNEVWNLSLIKNMMWLSLIHHEL